MRTALTIALAAVAAAAPPAAGRDATGSRLPARSTPNAHEARTVPLRLTVTSRAKERVLVCGRVRNTVMAATGSRPVAVVVGRGVMSATLTIQRCVAARWQRAARLRIIRRDGRHRVRLDARTDGDYRVRARAGRVRSRTVYLRVGGRPLRIRKDAADLTAQERTDFVDALLKLKATPSPYDPRLSWYDQLVAWHVYLAKCDPSDSLARNMMMGHAGPMFLPWHRQYLVLLEDALRTVSGRDVAVPYWDWSNPASTRAVFRDDLMGGDGDPEQDYAVTTGPFRKGRWRLNVHNYGLVFGPSATTYIARHFGSFPTAPTLPTADDEQTALRAPLYDVAPYDDSSDPKQSFRNSLEGLRNPIRLSGCMPDGVIGTLPLGETTVHGRAHVWAGGALPPSPAGALRFGTLAANIASPNDPVFFLLHSNVDRIWARWQQTHGTKTYLPASGYEHNSANDILHPFEQTGNTPTPADLADIHRLGYGYAPPSAPSTNRSSDPQADPALLVCTL